MTIIRRPLALAAFGALLAGAILGTPVAKASPETGYLDGLNSIGLVIYDTSRALATGYAICEAFKTVNGEIVAENLFLNTSWTDVPNLATAQAWVVIAGAALCPWQFHPTPATDRRLV